MILTPSRPAMTQQKLTSSHIADGFSLIWIISMAIALRIVQVLWPGGSRTHECMYVGRDLSVDGAKRAILEFYSIEAIITLYNNYSKQHNFNQFFLSLDSQQRIQVPWAIRPRVKKKKVVAGHNESNLIVIQPAIDKQTTTRNKFTVETHGGIRKPGRNKWL